MARAADPKVLEPMTVTSEGAMSAPAVPSPAALRIAAPLAGSLASSSRNGATGLTPALTRIRSGATPSSCYAISAVNNSSLPSALLGMGMGELPVPAPIRVPAWPTPGMVKTR